MLLRSSLSSLRTLITGVLNSASDRLFISTLVKETDIQVQEAQRVPNKVDTKRPTPRDIIIKITKVKDKEMQGCERMGER